MAIYSFKGSSQRFKQLKPQALNVMTEKKIPQTTFMYVCSTLTIKHI